LHYAHILMELQQVEELLGPPPTAPLSLAFGNSQGSECSSLSKFWSVLMVPPDEHQQQQLLQQQLHQQQLQQQLHQQQQQQPHNSMHGSGSSVSGGGNGQPLGIPLQDGDSSLGLRGITNRQVCDATTIDVLQYLLLHCYDCHATDITTEAAAATAAAAAARVTASTEMLQVLYLLVLLLLLALPPL
jgi:hypothetical protein